MTQIKQIVLGTSIRRYHSRTSQVLLKKNKGSVRNIPKYYQWNATSGDRLLIRWNFITLTLLPTYTFKVLHAFLKLTQMEILSLCSTANIRIHACMHACIHSANINWAFTMPTLPYRTIQKWRSTWGRYTTKVPTCREGLHIGRNQKPVCPGCSSKDSHRIVVRCPMATARKWFVC